MLNQAKKQARKAIESLYDCTCTIRAYESLKDPIKKDTKQGINPVPKYADKLCRISKQRLSKNTQTDTTNQVYYEIKLFIAPEIIIKQGDEIEVIKEGITTKYTAGEGYPYVTHQEVILSKEGKG
jgi:hypothetical protein